MGRLQVPISRADGIPRTGLVLVRGEGRPSPTLMGTGAGSETSRKRATGLSGTTAPTSESGRSPETIYSSQKHRVRGIDTSGGDKELKEHGRSTSCGWNICTWASPMSSARSREEGAGSQTQLGLHRSHKSRLEPPKWVMLMGLVAPISVQGSPGWLWDLPRHGTAWSPACKKHLAEGAGDSCPALPQPGNVLGMWQLPAAPLVNPGLAQPGRRWGTCSPIQSLLV